MNRLLTDVAEQTIDMSERRDPRAMKMALLLSALLAVACGGSPAPTPQRLADGSTRHFARSATVAVGSSATLSLYTHCGFDQAVIDFAGRLWGPVAPPIGAGNQGPANFADPIDEGTITLVGPNQASYLSATGRTILLRPLDAPLDVAPCY
jgi:hypothetical protein